MSAFALLYDKARSGRALSDLDVHAIASAEGQALAECLTYARRLNRDRHGASVGLCAIINAKSGACSEDCKFCAQSARHATDAPRHGFLATEDIVRAAQAAKDKGVRRFGIVVSGKELGEADFARLLAAVTAVRALGLHADVSAGLLGPKRLAALKEAGLSGVHHNLETSRTYFPQVCTTHDYEQDVQTVREAVKAGFYVCSGGIFGIGESWADRVELALTLKDLGAHSVPVNFLMPIPGTPYADVAPLGVEEALRIVALFRFLLPRANLRLCGGRHLIFGERRREALLCGADGVMVGDYLTTRGLDVNRDLADIAALGLTFAEDSLEPNPRDIDP